MHFHLIIPSHSQTDSSALTTKINQSLNIKVTFSYYFKQIVIVSKLITNLLLKSYTKTKTDNQLIVDFFVYKY